MPLPLDYLVAIWQKASKCEVGIAVETNNRAALRDQLYAVRRELGDGAFEDIIIFLPADSQELWLCRKDANEG